MKKKTFTLKELEDSLNALPVSDKAKKTLANLFRNRKEPVFFGYLVLCTGLLLLVVDFFVFFSPQYCELVPLVRNRLPLLFLLGFFTISAGQTCINRVNVRRAVIELMMNKQNDAPDSPKPSQ